MISSDSSNYATQLFCFALFTAAIAALFCTYSVYPFLTTADGILRWQLALSWINHTTIDRIYLLPPLGSFLMAISYYATETFGFYTFVQSFLMLFAGSALILRLIPSDYHVLCRLTAVSVFMTFPTASVFSVVLTDSALTFAGIASAICLLVPSEKGTKHNIKSCSLLFLSFILVFGMRFNSITVLPIFVYLIARHPSAIANRVVAFSCLVLALMTVYYLVPKIFKLPSRSPIALGMTWELVGLYKENPDPIIEKTLQEFGDPSLMVKKYFPAHLNELIWDGNAPLPAEVLTQAAAYEKIKSSFFNTVLTEPLKYARFKISQWGLTLGVTEPLLESHRGFHEVEPDQSPFGARVNNRESWMLNLFTDTTQSLQLITLRPFVMFLICFLMLIAMWMRKHKNIQWLAVLFVTSILYYSGFLLQTQAMEFRYFAPSFFLSMVLLIVSFAELVQRITKKPKYRA